MNQVFLTGNIGSDPEHKKFDSGSSKVSVSMATSEYYKDKEGESQQKTEWHRLVFWNKKADLAERLIRKGTRIAVSGKITYNQWQDKDGNNRVTTEIVVLDFQVFDKKESSDDSQYEPAGSTSGGGAFDDNGEVPF